MQRFRLNLHMLQILAAKLRPKKDAHVISMCQSTCAKPQRKRFSKATVTGKIAYLKMAKTQCCHSLTIQNPKKGFYGNNNSNKKSFESPTKPNPFQASLCVSSTRSLLKNMNIQQRLTQDKALRVRASRPDGNSLN